MQKAKVQFEEFGGRLVRRDTLGLRCAFWLGLWTLLLASIAQAAAPFIPRTQKAPPGPPLSPQQAIARMTVPEGFSVELVAAEPDLVNPVAMTFDERGRIWIAESLEYPRRQAGPGRDRVKVLEDRDGDGRAEHVTLFTEGLNIPSGIAVGAGGVWIANAPDILFMQDTDGDGRADRREVVVTGFGRDDTHELPNSLLWGPDGWLYGLNGVFNPSTIRQRGREFRFTCAMFRIHPRTREFQIFAQGTSNPWGIAWDSQGSAFVSACVIDHLWHITESGYYQRQGGPYPPHTWKLGSIVEHTHQLAAYCGIHFFDSDAYPARYREKLYMGNIHGGCINCDRLARRGSTYVGTAEPDFLTANDVWFMPVSQQTGPDGCLYVLDWYDRYHCYQDANHDPAGIDRGRGRLYRIRYKETPRTESFDLALKSDNELIDLLGSPNIYFRNTAQRLLWERQSPAAAQRLQQLVADDHTSRKARMHALWALIGMGPLEAEFHKQLLHNADAGLRAWAVRAAGNERQVADAVRLRVVAMANDPSPDVRLQVAIAAGKIEGLAPLPLLVDVLCQSGGDPLIPAIVWQNLHPLLPKHARQLLADWDRRGSEPPVALVDLMPRVIDRLLDDDTCDGKAAAELIERLLSQAGRRPEVVGEGLAALARALQSSQLPLGKANALRQRLEPLLAAMACWPHKSPAGWAAAVVASRWDDAHALRIVREVLASPGQQDADRLEALDALRAANDPNLLETLLRMVTAAGPAGASLPLRQRALDALARLDSDRVASDLLASYPTLPPALKSRAIDVMTERPAWGRALVNAIGGGQIPPTALNPHQVRKLAAHGDLQLDKAVGAIWGIVRTERNPDRQRVVEEMKRQLARTPGDARAGRKLFATQCGQCHKIYGEGQEVGPDITRNGRSDYDQLLVSVFDPNLIIGAPYQVHTAITQDGRIVVGILVEETPSRVVLKGQGGKLEVLRRDQIEQLQASPLSLMPEQLEKQLTPQQWADLFAFLLLDRPPEDPQARPLPGTPASLIPTSPMASGQR